MTYYYKGLGLAAALALSPMVASAATISVEANAPASWSAVDTGATTTLGAGANWEVGSIPATVSGSLNGAYKSPFDPASANAGVDVPEGDAISGWENLTYFTIGSPAPNVASSPAILKLDQSKDILSLLWGSIDTYNSIEFYNGTNLNATVSGQQVLDNGGTPAASGAALVRISDVGMFDEVRFFSNFGNSGGVDTPAFEFSNVVVTAVPLPAAGWLMLAGFGGLAALRRRKQAA